LSFRDLLYLVFGNLARMKARVAMTAIGVVIGTAAVVVLVSLAAGLQHSFAENLGSIGDLTRITVLAGSYLRAFGGPPSGRAGEEAVLNDRALAVEQEILSRGFIAYSARSTLQSMNIFFLVIQGIFGGIGAIALIVAAFGIANTMTMAIYERTREIGLMKAVGATNRDVMSAFLAEAGSIGLLGGLGGVLLGTGLGALIDLIAGTYLAAQAVQSGATASDVNISIIHTPLWLPVFALLFSALVGVISGVYPAVRAASLSPVDALKYE